MNYVFFGTPDVASQTLEILKQAGYLPSLIVTSPDRPVGRKMLLTPPPVKTWAIENNIPYIQPKSLKNFSSEEFGLAVRSEKNSSDLKVDLFIVVAYGKILPEEIIKFPRLGSINIHYSLLPKYRGASPVESAILNGDIETGITIQQMEYKMDTGPILAVEKVEILPDEKAGELRSRLIKIGGELLVKMLPDFTEGKTTPIPQDESQAINCKKMTKEDGLIDLNDDATKNYNKFRAYATWPRTYFFKPARNAESIASVGGDEKRIIITDASLEDGKFVIKRVIPEGGKEQEYKN